MDLHRFTPVHPDAMVSEPDGTHVLYSQVEPLEALTTAQAGIISQSGEENARLRALVQVLFDALANMKIDIYGPLTTELKAAVIALNAAKEEGFVPTNTEDK